MSTDRPDDTSEAAWQAALRPGVSPSEKPLCTRCGKREMSETYTLREGQPLPPEGSDRWCAVCRGDVKSCIKRKADRSESAPRAGGQITCKHCPVILRTRSKYETCARCFENGFR